jgi:DNA-3-methyladenine glycosylase II
MWYVKSKDGPNWSAAERHLRRADPVLAKIIGRVGHCTIVPRRDYFNLLCVSIFNQQISTKIATILYNRFRDQFPRRRPTPPRVRAFLLKNEELARKCGVSRQKRGYLLDLSQKFIDRQIPVRRFAKMSDEQVIESLTQVKGIGRWTAEMFLMFVLNRPDVLPVDDLGLQEAAKRAFGLSDRPKARQFIELAEPWRPWRTVASWYLWRGMEDKRPVKR